jgi:hypothetical protein
MTGCKWAVNDPTQDLLDDKTHVYPLNDSQPHTLFAACPCGPRFDGNITIHNSFDAVKW